MSGYVLLYGGWSRRYIHVRLCLRTTIELLHSFLVEGDVARGKCENRVVFTHADVEAGHEMGATLSDNDSSRRDDFPTKCLYAQSLRLGIATVFRGTTCFFMCHIGERKGNKSAVLYRGRKPCARDSVSALQMLGFCGIMVGFMKYTKLISSAALITMMFYGMAQAEPVTDLTPVEAAPLQVDKVPLREKGSAIPSAALDAKSLNNALFLLQIQQDLKSAYLDYHKLNSVIGTSQEHVNGLKDQLGTLRDEIVHFQKEISVSEARIKNVATRVGLQSKEIGLLEEEIVTRGIALEEQKTLLADYMRMIYINEHRFREGDFGVDLSSAKLLLSDATLGEMVQQMTTLDMLQHSGQTMLEKLRGSQDAIAVMQQSVSGKKKELDALKNKLLSQRVRLEDEKLAKERLLQVTHGEDQIYKKLIAESLAQQDESLLQINALQSNFNYVKDNLSKLGNSVGVSDIQKLLDERTQQIYTFQQQADVDSVFSWPVSPSRGISAYFHDSAYRGRFGVDHQAIDIPTLQGTAIHAPKDGIVYKVQDNGMGYSYIIVSHKGQLMTVYGHVSAILVKEGQAVAAGTVLGLTGGVPGTKGAGYMTTGAHLHFEVFSKGVHVDPLDYLSLSRLPLDDLPAKYAKRVESEGIMKRATLEEGISSENDRASEKSSSGKSNVSGTSGVRGAARSSGATGTSDGATRAPAEVEKESYADHLRDLKMAEEVQKAVEENGRNEVETYRKIFGE